MATRRRKVLILLASVPALGGCTDLLIDSVVDGTGPVLVEQRSVGPFTGVANTTQAAVEILQGSTERVVVTAEESILPYLRTRVEGGVLRIYADNVTLRPRQPITVAVDMVTLNRLQSSGSGRIDALVIDARRLEVNSSGSGDIDLPSLLADTLVVLSSGSGDVTATGNVQRLRLNMSASGRVDTRELAAHRVVATISGSGSAWVRARDRIDATLSGSGFLRYYGSPTVQHVVTGSGRVERVGS